MGIKQNSTEKGGRKKVAIVQFSSNLDGSSISGLMLADGLKEKGYDTYVLFAHEGPIIAKYEEAGHTVAIVPHKNWLRARKVFRFLRIVYSQRKAASSFNKVFTDIKPEVVYVNTAASYAGVFAASSSKIPVIWHIRELFNDAGGEMKVPSVLKKWAQNHIARQSDKLITNSKTAAVNMLGRNYEQAVIVPNAVDNFFFEDRREKHELLAKWGLPSDRIYVGVPGTLRPLKGHPFFFDALAILKNRYPKIMAVVSGEGKIEYKLYLEKYVKTLGLEQNVKFLGYIDDMSGFYRLCSLVCIPSKSESFGRTVIEAFATKIPVVASAVGGILEIIKDNETGLLVSYNDAQQLANRVIEILEDEGIRYKLSQNARKVAEEKYRAASYKARLSSIVDSFFT